MGRPVHVIVQIYTMQSPAEALGVVTAGADRVGVTPAARGLPGEVDTATARAIVEAVRDRATTVALTVEHDLDSIVAMVDAVRPDVVHLCPEPGALAPDDVVRLRGRLPTVRIVQAIAVDGPVSVERAAAFEPVADELILDTHSRDVEGTGVSGAVHDWTISAEIVRRVRVPVVLAGGLGPHNVATAVEAVRPSGVDSLTHTQTEAVERAAQALADARRTVVARIGGDGALAVCGSGTIRSPGFPTTVVDTVGAGDAFDAGFICASREGRGVAEALRWGNAVAALSVAGYGARALPRRNDVEHLLATR